MKVIGYVRVSSESQRENTSLESQKTQIEGYCQAMNYQLDSVVSEVGSGGSIGRRKEFKKLIQRVLEDDDIEGIITHKLDRFARNLKDLTNLVDKLNEQGKFLVCFGDNINTKDSNSLLLMGVLGSVAEWERKKINERVKLGIKSRVEQSGTLSKRRDSDKNPEPISLIEVESWKEDRRNKLSLRAIASKYNRHLTTVARVLKSEAKQDKSLDQVAKQLRRRA